MKEPIVTWNLFLTALLVPLSVTILGLIFKNWLVSAKDGWLKYEQQKEKDLTEWRTRFSTTLCAVKKDVTDIKIGLEGKVTWTAHDIIEKDISDIGHRLSVVEVGLDDIKGICRDNHRVHK